MKFNNLNIAKKYLIEALETDAKYKVINITGPYFSGKTELLNNVISDLDFIKNFDVSSLIRNIEVLKFSPDITESIFDKSNLKFPEFKTEETDFLKSKFYNHLSLLQISDKKLFKNLTSRLNLNNNKHLDDEFEKVIKDNFDSSIKVLLSTKSMELSIESFLIDILNNFFPLDSSNNLLSDYLVTRNSINILLTFDNAQIFTEKHFNWIEKLFDYLLNKRLSDLISVEYNREDSDLIIGELINLSVIISSRNNKFSYNHNEVKTDNIVMMYPDEIELMSGMDVEDSAKYQYFKENDYLLVPNIISYFNKIRKNTPIELIDKDIYIYVTENILKYIPEKYKKLILFLSLFDDLKKTTFNLYPELSFSSSEIDQIIRICNFFEFLPDESIQINKNEIHILRKIAQDLVNEQEYKELNKLNTQINDLFKTLQYDEFEELRKIAYFDRFEKSYSIPEFFKDNAKLVNNSLDKINSYIDTNKFTKSLNENILQILRKYNKLSDGERYSEYILRTNEISKNYLVSLKERNKNLNNEINYLITEIDSYQNDNKEIKENKEKLSREILDIENDIIQKNQLLKPYNFKNTKQKKATNIIALILSVAVIFNSDRIAEFIFDSKSDFDYVILTTVLLLLLLYMNGLIRYFKSKLNKEEIYKLRLEKDKLENKLNELKQDLNIVSANYKAKQSKIEDLKRHIERMNTQILNNKMKIDEPLVIKDKA